MKKLIITAIFLFSINALYSQYQVGGTGESIDRAREVNRMTKLNNFSLDRMQKSKLSFFLEDEWQGGVMFASDSSTINGFSYRYNIYTDQVELRSLVDPGSIKMLTIGTKKFVYSTFLNNENIEDAGYFELISNGECKLLLRRQIEFTRASGDIEAYGANESTKIDEKLFIKKGEDVAVELVKSKEFLRDFISDKEQAVEYLDEKLVIFLTEKKIKEIIDYYNNI
ncbi:MAG: hypothetical protein C0597_01600 [Marinilabiliales bacterium]|nr:MAG: hypothetical protein C0597_01600 [Marinilabiliales bacterium]